MTHRQIIFSIIAVLAVILSLIVGSVLQRQKTPEAVVPSATTAQVVHCDNDAKLCPDGSTVLRAGEACEFVACPSIYGNPENWQTRTDDTVNKKFRYPVTLGTNYVSTQDWPPTFSFVEGESPCRSQEKTETPTGEFIKEDTFNGINYCVVEKNEGAAGSTYTEYQIIFSKGSDLLNMHFTLRRPQCANYDGSEQSACAAAQDAFKVIELAASIADTLQ